MPSQRIQDNKAAMARKKEAQQIRQRRINGQQRGDLRAPNKNDQRYNYNTYHDDYFTGVQCKVYFGDIWVDDIVTIQYNVVQNKEPIYGYASQNFDAVTMGTVLGQGTLTISFKEVGYLNVIKALLDEQKNNISTAKDNVLHRLQNNKESEISSNVRTSSEYAATINRNFTPSLIRKSETIEEILDNLKGLNTGAKDLSNPTGQDIFRGEAGVRDFEDIAEIMEDTIWGDSNGKPFGSKSAQMLRADEFDHKFKFKNGGAIGINSAVGDNYTDVLNIMLSFGDLNDFRGEHTIVLLNDVHFTGQGMISTPNGEPIAESYQFFFRDINKSISETVFNINPVKFSIGTDSALELSRLKDVETFTKLLDDNPAVMHVQLLSKFTDGVWTPENNSFNATGLLGYMFQSNDSWGRAHALNNYIEEAMRLWYVTKSFNERPERVAIRVELVGQTGNSPMELTEFNYILDRVGQDTSLYKVTSPTKDDFTSLNLVRREDFFLPVPPTPPVEEDPLPEIPEFPPEGDVTIGSTLPKGKAQDDMNNIRIREDKRINKQIDDTQPSLEDDVVKVAIERGFLQEGQIFDDLPKDMQNYIKYQLLPTEQQLQTDAETLARERGFLTEYETFDDLSKEDQTAFRGPLLTLEKQRVVDAEKLALRTGVLGGEETFDDLTPTEQAYFKYMALPEEVREQQDTIKLTKSDLTVDEILDIEDRRINKQLNDTRPNLDEDAAKLAKKIGFLTEDESFSDLSQRQQDYIKYVELPLDYQRQQDAEKLTKKQEHSKVSDSEYDRVFFEDDWKEDRKSKREREKLEDKDSFIYKDYPNDRSIRVDNTGNSNEGLFIYEGDPKDRTDPTKTSDPKNRTPHQLILDYEKNKINSTMPSDSKNRVPYQLILDYEKNKTNSTNYSDPKNTNILINVKPTNTVEYTNRDPKVGEIWVGVGDTPAGHRKEKAFTRKKNYTNLGAFDYVVYKTSEGGKSEEVNQALNLIPGTISRATRTKVEVKTSYQYNESDIYVKYLHVDGSDIKEGDAVDRFGYIGTLKPAPLGKHLHVEFFFKDSSGKVVYATPKQVNFLHNELITKKINVWSSN